MDGTDRRRRPRDERVALWRLADLVDRHVADPGGVVAGQLRLDDATVAVNVDVSVDHVGLVGAAGRAAALGRRAREGGFRRELLEGALRQALDAADLGAVAAGPRCGLLRVLGAGLGLLAARQVARIFAGAELVARRPHELVRLALVGNPGIGIVAKTEGDAASAVRPHIRRTFLGAIVEADVVTADRPPGALGVDLVAQRARLVRRGERILGAEAEVADAAALGDQHHRALTAFRERDVAHRLAEAGACDVGVTVEEVWQHELAPNVGRVEAAVRIEPHRPHRVALVVVRGLVPAGLPESRARPDRIEQPRLVRHGVTAHAETPHPAAAGGEVPALRAVVELSTAIVDAGARVAVERDRRQARALAVFRVDEAGSALRTVIVDAEVGAVGRA